MKHCRDPGCPARNDLWATAWLSLMTAMVVVFAQLLAGGWPMHALAAGACVGVALAPAWRRVVAKESAFVAAWMTLAGLLGWLLGIRYEGGPFGLAILESWCSTSSLAGIEAALAKLRQFPISALAMLGGSMVGMWVALWGRGRRRLLCCCIVGFVIMPLAMLTADAGVLDYADRVALPATTLMIGAMAAAMVAAGLLSGWIAGGLERLWLRWTAGGIPGQ